MSAAEVERPLTERRCGRPTRSGNACRTRVYGVDVACGTHATEQDRAVAAAYQQGWRDGYQQGQQSAPFAGQLQIERLERRMQDLEERLDTAQRYHEIGRDQVVEIGSYPPLVIWGTRRTTVDLGQRIEARPGALRRRRNQARSRLPKRTLLHRAPY